MDASRLSLQKLTVANIRGLRKVMKPLQDNRNVADDMPYMRSLRTITLEILHLGCDEFTWPCLDEAVGILDMVPASSLVSNVVFGSHVLALIAHGLPSMSKHPSVRLFEQSMARFSARQISFSCWPQHKRKNRDGFWTPVLAKAFPLLYKQGKLGESSG